MTLCLIQVMTVGLVLTRLPVLVDLGLASDSSFIAECQFWWHVPSLTMVVCGCYI